MFALFILGLTHQQPMPDAGNPNCRLFHWLVLDIPWTFDNFPQSAEPASNFILLSDPFIFTIGDAIRPTMNSIAFFARV